MSNIIKEAAEILGAHIYVNEDSGITYFYKGDFRVQGDEDTATVVRYNKDGYRIFTKTTKTVQGIIDLMAGY